MNTNQFLECFDGNICYCALDDKRSNPELTHFHEGFELSRDAILRELSEANAAGFGVFFCVNEIDRSLDPQRHRTTRMIKRCRAVWADMDEPVAEPITDWPLPPSLVVNTSPGKYHYYWLTSTTDFHEWGQVMNGIANTYHSDANSRDIVRVLRLPGYLHHKKDPFESLVVDDNARVYTWEEITSAFPPDENTPKVTTSERGESMSFSDFESAIKSIEEGTNYHGAIMWLLNHWANKGIKSPDELKALVKSMLAKAKVQDERWLARNEEHYLDANVRDAIRFVNENPLDDDVKIDIIEYEEKQENLGWPPGLMGRLCQEIYEMAPHPNEEIAILSAFSLVAGITGRTFNVLGSGLNLYTACLARSGIGKAVIKDSINVALRTIGVLNNGPTFIGPSRITGPKALLKNLHEHPSRILIMEESGLLSASRAGDTAGISRILLELYTSSGRNQWFGAEAYSNKDDSSAAIRAPAVTIAHVSTPESYIRALKSKDSVNSGDLARIWTIRSLRDKSYLNTQRRLEFSKDIADRIVQVLGACKINQDGEFKNNPKVIDLDTSLIDVDAEDKYWVDIENNTYRSDPVKATIASRAALKIMKIASVASVFNDTGGKVGVDEYAWAKKAIEVEFKTINLTVTLGDSSDLDSVINYIALPAVTKIVNYGYKNGPNNPPEVFRGRGIFSRSNLYHSLKNHTTIKAMDSDTQKSGGQTGLDKVIDGMLRAGFIVQLTKQDLRALGYFKRAGAFYKITPMFNELAIDDGPRVKPNKKA